MLCLAAPLFAANAADEVRGAETAFAKAFADRDKAAFFAFVADDAYFLTRKGTLNGKEEIKAVWSKYFADAKAPFSWKPERVVANAAGNLGLSTGPVTDADGTQVSVFSSVWQKQADGSWKIIFDGPGAPTCPPPAEKH